MTLYERTIVRILTKRCSMRLTKRRVPIVTNSSESSHSMEPFAEMQVMTDRRRFFRVFFVLLAFGLISFVRVLGRPSLASVRAVDIVQLIGAGMCLGGALVALVVALGRPPSG